MIPSKKYRDSIVKNWILKAIPEINIMISCPTIRMDNQKARLTSLNIHKKLSELNINIIDNEIPTNVIEAAEFYI